MITLQRLSASELQSYRLEAIELLADAEARAFDLPPGETRAGAERALQVLLQPDAETSDRQQVFSVRYGETRVGWLWFEVRDAGSSKIAFLKDIIIDGPWRARGFGKLAISAFENEARNAGCRRVILNVFADNHHALTLYRKSGYVTASFALKKSLEVRIPTSPGVL